MICKKNVRILIPLLFLFYTCSAFSVRDISIQKENRELLNLRDSIEETIEPLLKRYNQEHSLFIKESVSKKIQNIIYKIEKNPKRDTVYELHLAMALMWHYLAQVNKIDSQNRFDSLVFLTQSRFPDSMSVLWLKAINLVQRKQTLNGLWLFDSLSRNGIISRSSFFTDYVETVKSIFLPSQRHSIDSIMSIFDNSREPNSYSLIESEQKPSEITMNLKYTTDNYNKLPNYSLGIKFLLKEEFSLILPEFMKLDQRRLNVNADDRILKAVVGSLAFNYGNFPYDADITIDAGINNAKISLYEFIQKLIKNQYDVVAETDLAKNIQGISVKCYNIRTYSGISPDYHIYVVFDKITDFNFNELNRKLIKKNDTFLLIRYLVTLKTSKIVENKAELLIREIMKSFY
jgi:hypothetical protein